MPYTGRDVVRRDLCTRLDDAGLLIATQRRNNEEILKETSSFHRSSISSPVTASSQ